MPTPAELPDLLSAARGDTPSDLVLRNARLVNVASGDVHEAEIAILGRHVAGVGQGFRAREEVDLKGAFVAPGLLDAHVHVESAMVPPSEFARLVVPRGVTAAVTDPHEIANVAGVEGIRFMIADARRSPLAMYVNASSCVPATHLGTAGATLEAKDLAPLLGEPEVLGLAEVMNYPGVVHGDPKVLEKLEAFRGRPIDGHCPGLSGHALDAYVAAGIESDHECTRIGEAREKLRLGMTLFLREATNAKNLAALLPLVSPATERHICLCTDDRQVPDLVHEGSIDHLVRMTIAAGVDPVTAIRMATLNVAERFRIPDRGVIAPGRFADLVTFRDLDAPRAERVYASGRLVARDGKMLAPRTPVAAAFTDSVRIDWSKVSLRIPARGRRVRAIGAIPDQLVTAHLKVDAKVENGEAVADPSRDLLKMAVIGRHAKGGRVGLGFVQGVGLRGGAIAGTVAHDHHNLVVIGADDRSMLAAAKAVGGAGGGLAAARGDEVLALLPLPIGGLMSDRPHEEVGAGLEALVAAAAKLGSKLRDPFMAMSFLALEVIPALKLTDQGLVDVDAFAPVPLFVE
ncbi:MAG TPA: adenine deaminase [Planctomycetota bacterium]|nr:adenine deaminase [Planctomycetota bacterium]